MDSTDAMTPVERLQQVQAQAKQEVGSEADLARDNQIADASHYGSMAAGAALAAKGGWVGLAAYGAGVGGGMAGAWLADKLGAADATADALEWMGMRRIGSGGPHPATKDHQVAHSYAFAGMLAAIAVGVVAAVVVGAAIVATGGVAAVAIVGAAAAGGFAGGFFGSALGGALSQMGSRTGPIIEGSPDVFIEGRPAARMTDKAACSKESSPQPIVEGSETIFVNGLPLSRLGHQLLCGAKIDEGAKSVFMDETTAACAQPAPDIPLGARIAADWLGFLPLGKFAAGLGRQARPSAKTVSAQATGKPRACATHCKDPVDVASGEFVDWRTDIAVPGVLPIELRRHYASRRPLTEGATTAGLFGPRWLDNWSVRLRRHPGAVLIDYFDDEGVVYTFDTPDDVLEAEHLRAPHLVLRGTREHPVLHDRERGIRMHFEWQGATARLSGYSDASGNRCDFAYAPRGGGQGGECPVSLHHSDGWHIALHWRDGHLYSAWLHEPDRAPVELVRYQHDEQGRLVHAASEASGRLQYRYDNQHRIIGWGDDTDTQVTIAYDDAGRVAEVRTPGDLHSGRFRYDEEQGITEVWDDDPALPHEQREALCSTYRYNSDGLVTWERDPLGHETHTEWDRHFRVVSRTDALGRRTRYQHDDTGRLVQVVDPQGRRTKFEHDAEGRVVGVTDPNGRQLECSYDAAGRLASETDAAGTRTFEYDARGRLRTEHGPQGRIAEYHYDDQHRPCGHTAANGAHTSWRQDRLGRIDWETDPTGATTTYEHAADGSPDEPLPEGPSAQGHVQPARVVAADGGSTRLAYTREGLLTERTDARGHRQHWLWGAFDLLAAHTDEQGHTTHYRYGRDARLSELINAAGQRWRWIYDAAGRLAEQIDYAGRRTRWERDPVGRPLRRIAPDNQTLHYEWDAADRVRAIRASDGTRITYQYDALDQLSVARVWRHEPEHAALESELRLAYDESGRLLEEAHRGEFGAERRLAYRYDDQGWLIAREGPLGEVEYQHDALGLLKELRTAHGAVRIERDILGRETQRTSAPARPQVPTAPHFRLQQSFDKLGRLVQQRVHTGQSVADAVNRRYHWQHERLLGVDDSRFGSVRWELDAREQIREARYDAAHESVTDAAMLAEHPRSLGSRAPRPHAGQSRERYDYDAVGNLSVQGSEPIRLRYAADTVSEHGPLRYEWDACGRLSRRTETRPGFRPRTWHYEWDAFDRLKRVTTPEGQRWRYLYDAFGRRRGKRCENWSPPPNRSVRRPQLQQAEYLWDGATLAAQWKLYADGSSEAPREEVQEWHHEPGTFTPLALVQQRHGQTQMLHVVSDLNGAPRELLAHDGEVVWAAQLGTWGHLSRCHVKDRDRAYAARFAPGYRAAANDPEVDVELRFANQWEDEESGLFYNLNRYYDPAVGQYVSQDPLGPAGGIRTHGYVHNPLTWVDPLGLNGCVAAAIKSIDQQLASGKGASARVDSRAHAEELLIHYTTGRNQPGGWKNTTHTEYDMRGSQWLPDNVNRGPKGRYGTYHWDEYNPTAARGDHASEGSHLQLHTWGGKVIRVFYD